MFQFGLTKEEIKIKIDENASIDEIKEKLTEKLIELKKLYKDEKTPIRVTGKVLKNDEIEQINKLIKEAIKVEVKFDSPQELGLQGIKKAFNKEIETSETKYYKGSLRCGQRLEYEGSIVILGDVNGGAEVVASDHIVILGKLRGLAHAGAKGNKKAIIASQKIEAPQIRIANIVKEIEKTEEEKISKIYAYIDEEKIVLE